MSGKLDSNEPHELLRGADPTDSSIAWPWTEQGQRQKREHRTSTIRQGTISSLLGLRRNILEKRILL